MLSLLLAYFSISTAGAPTDDAVSSSWRYQGRSFAALDSNSCAYRPTCEGISACYLNKSRIFFQLRQQVFATKYYNLSIEFDSTMLHLPPMRCVATARQQDDAVLLGGLLPSLEKQKYILSKLSDAVYRDPYYAKVYADRAHFFRKIGNYRAAAQDLTHAINLTPKNVFFRLDRGNVYQDMHNRDAAVADYEKVIEIAPKIGVGWRARGELYESENNLILAIHDIKRFTELRPEDALGWQGLSRLYKKVGNCRLSDIALGKAEKLGLPYAIPSCSNTPRP